MPVTGKVKQSVSKELIFSKLSEGQIYRHYLGEDFILRKPMRSPFHKDETPSFSIVETDKGHLQHTDWADNQFIGGAIDFVMQLFSLSYYESLKKINHDFSLGVGTIEDRKAYQRMVNEMTHEPRKETLIQVVSRRFTKEDLAYWNLYHIDQGQLKGNDIYSVGKLFINGDRKLIPIGEPVFGYLYGDKWKIYRPFAEDKKDKWKNNAPIYWLSGRHRMANEAENGFVTKSKKDEVVLAKFLPAVCSCQNESKFSINGDNIAFLQGTGKRIFINFDNDETGLNASKYYNQFGFGWVNAPQSTLCKDFADMARYHGMDSVISYFKHKNLLK